LPIEGFATNIDLQAGCPNALFLFVITRVYGGTLLVEIDPANEKGKPFSSLDKFGQVHKGKADIKVQCEIESLEKWGIDLRDEVVEINVNPFKFIRENLL
jgi:hypothetical protein